MRTTDLPIPPDPANAPLPAADAAPSPPPPHTTVISSDQPLELRLAQDDRWFKVLNWLWDSGTWAEITDGQRNVLMTLVRLRDDQSGLSYAPIDDLCRLTGLRRAGVYKILAELVEHPRTLLARCGPSRFRTLPGRTPRTRGASRSESAPGQSTPMDLRAERVHLCRQKSTQVDSESTPVDAAASAPQGTCARSIETELRIKNSIDDGVRASGRNSIDRTAPPAVPSDPESHDPRRLDRLVGQPHELEEALRLLRAGAVHIKPIERLMGFQQRDALSLLEQTEVDLETVRVAVTNANHLAEKNQIKSTWRGYVATQLRNGCSLFAGVRHLPQQVGAIDARLRALACRFGDDDSAAMLNRWWSELAPAMRGLALSRVELDLADEQLWKIVLARAWVATHERARPITHRPNRPEPRRRVAAEE